MPLPFRRRRSIDPGDGRDRAPRTTAAGRMLVESVLIVASVLLGFGLNAWGERRAARDTERAAIERFRQEIRANLEAVEEAHPRHAAFARRLAESVPDSLVAGSAFDVFYALMPEGGLNMRPLRDAAWETALSTGALRLLDYDTAAMLSETYLVQHSSIQPTLERLSDRIMDPRTFDPAQRDLMLRVHQMTIQELAGQQRYLMVVYENALEQLDGGAR